ncbi:MAG TPA: ATP-binding protein [Dehalococcoidia bacterium]|nr:ATP-binding protein [Dehalococcoidia bacterium]
MISKQKLPRSSLNYVFYSCSIHTELGLAGIQERAHLLGGTIQVTSSPGKGTYLTIEIPLG